MLEVVTILLGRGRSNDLITPKNKLGWHFGSLRYHSCIANSSDLSGIVGTNSLLVTFALAHLRKLTHSARTRTASFVPVVATRPSEQMTGVALCSDMLPVHTPHIPSAHRPTGTPVHRTVRMRAVVATPVLAPGTEGVR